MAHQAGSAADLERLMEEYGTGLLRLCALQLGDAALAEDAAQETLLRAWRRYGTFRGEAAERTWITAIALNVCRDLLRSPWHTHRMELSALADYFAVSLDYLVRGIEPEKPAAPSPQQAVIQNYYRGWRYEYRSRRTLFGLPLVHINLCDRSLCRAKGVIAIGNVATGLIAIGGFSAGLLTLGGFSAGLLALGGLAAGGISLGGLSVGLLAALGGAAFSLGIAFGGGAVSGYAALGGAAVGQYAAGGTAFGSTLAIGRDAYSSAAGLALTLEQLHGYSPEVLFQMIHAQLPEAPEWVVRLLLCVCP